MEDERGVFAAAVERAGATASASRAARAVRAGFMGRFPGWRGRLLDAERGVRALTGESGQAGVQRRGGGGGGGRSGGRSGSEEGKRRSGCRKGDAANREGCEREADTGLHIGPL